MSTATWQIYIAYTLDHQTLTNLDEQWPHNFHMSKGIPIFPDTANAPRTPLRSWHQWLQWLGLGDANVDSQKYPQQILDHWACNLRWNQKFHDHSTPCEKHRLCCWSRNCCREVPLHRSTTRSGMLIRVSAAVWWFPKIGLRQIIQSSWPWRLV